MAWWHEGAYAPGSKVFDIGTTTSTALRALERGVHAIDAGPAGERASGNGSLMRILPVALVGRDLDDAKLVEQAHLASRVTHGHPRCQVACALYVLVAKRLLHAESRAAGLATATDSLRVIYASDDGLAAHREALGELLGWKSRSGRGLVLDAFWSAWDAFADASSYRETVELAIRYGHDTDTTAAIAGGLAGIHWGWQGIPAEWLDGMRSPEIVTSLVDRLVTAAGWITSSSSPLRVDTLDAASVPGLAGVAGRAGITFLPGKKYDSWSKSGRPKQYWRDVRSDAVEVHRLGFDVFLLLVEDHELDWCSVTNIGCALAREGIDFIRFPILDPRTPADGAAYRATIVDLLDRMRAGKSVAIACRGGLDRSGMTAACLLREAGVESGEAIRIVQEARHGALTEPEQQGYVWAWPPASSASPRDG